MSNMTTHKPVSLFINSRKKVQSQDLVEIRVEL